MKIDRLRTYMTRDKDRPRLLVAIDTDDGLTGWGECYNHGPDRALAPLLEYLFTFLQGQDPRRIEYIVQYLMQQTRFPPGALTLAAISAIDHCLWDISAKALGVPVYMLLGGNVRDRVRVYAGVYTAPDAPAAREEFDRLNENWGLTAFKLSPYRINIYENRWGEVVRTSAEYFRSLRETVRNDYEIAFDAHARIFEPHQAVQLGNALAPYDPLFFEEPIRPENVEVWGDIKRQMACTLATGESLYNRFEFLRLLSHRGADIIQPDICVVGGLLGDAQDRGDRRGALRHRRAAQPDGPAGHGGEPAFLRRPAEFPHPRIPAAARPELHVRSRAAAAGAKADPSAGAWYVKDPYLPRDGYLELRPDRPGWGVEIDEEVLKTDGYVHWERRVGRRPDGSSAFP